MDGAAVPTDDATGGDMCQSPQDAAPSPTAVAATSGGDPSEEMASVAAVPPVQADAPAQAPSPAGEDGAVSVVSCENEEKDAANGGDVASASAGKAGRDGTADDVVFCDEQGEEVCDDIVSDADSNPDTEPDMDLLQALQQAFQQAPFPYAEDRKNVSADPGATGGVVNASTASAAEVNCSATVAVSADRAVADGERASATAADVVTNDDEAGDGAASDVGDGIDRRFSDEEADFDDDDCTSNAGVVSRRGSNSCWDVFPEDGMAPVVGVETIDVEEDEMEDPGFARTRAPRLTLREQRLRELLSGNGVRDTIGRSYRDLIRALRPRTTTSASNGSRIPVSFKMKGNRFKIPGSTPQVGTPQSALSSAKEKTSTQAAQSGAAGKSSSGLADAYTSVTAPLVLLRAYSSRDKGVFVREGRVAFEDDAVQYPCGTLVPVRSDGDSNRLVNLATAWLVVALQRLYKDAATRKLCQQVGATRLDLSPKLATELLDYLLGKRDTCSLVLKPGELGVVPPPKPSRLSRLPASRRRPIVRLTDLQSLPGPSSRRPALSRVRHDVRNDEKDRDPTPEGTEVDDDAVDQELLEEEDDGEVLAEITANARQARKKKGTSGGAAEDEQSPRSRRKNSRKEADSKNRKRGRSEPEEKTRKSKARRTDGSEDKGSPKGKRKRDKEDRDTKEEATKRRGSKSRKRRREEEAESEAVEDKKRRKASKSRKERSVEKKTKAAETSSEDASEKPASRRKGSKRRGESEQPGADAKVGAASSSSSAASSSEGEAEEEVAKAQAGDEEQTKKALKELEEEDDELLAAVSSCSRRAGQVEVAIRQLSVEEQALARLNTKLREQLQATELELETAIADSQQLRAAYHEELLSVRTWAAENGRPLAAAEEEDPLLRLLGGSQIPETKLASEVSA
eukprot:TRINITY_DN35066_c0_g1_i1.p1 TRINITY_DN35066_c0_g1~~TRINITY_DN35066_c0_g1_i1.p1  ORF type:complete len:912 (-),score=214.63 TRINITY_DN35066_c0_g1_i1:28-2763(-)